MMLLPMVSPYDDDPVKKDVIDTGHDQLLRYSMTGSYREGDQTRKVRWRSNKERPYSMVIYLHEKRIG